MSYTVTSLPSQAPTFAEGGPDAIYTEYKDLIDAIGMDRAAFDALVPSEISAISDKPTARLVAITLYMSALTLLSTTKIPRTERAALLDKLIAVCKSARTTPKERLKVELEQVFAALSTEQKSALDETAAVLMAGTGTSQYAELVRRVKAERAGGSTFASDDPWYKESTNIALIVGGGVAVAAVGVVMHRRRRARVSL
jgi:hypothetical protein